MISKVYSIKDETVGFFNPPFICRSDAEAIRGFSFLINDKECQLSRYPEHYNLYVLSEFDDETGLFNFNSPVLLFNGSSLVNREVSHG